MKGEFVQELNVIATYNAGFGTVLTVQSHNAHAAIASANPMTSTPILKYWTGQPRQLKPTTVQNVFWRMPGGQQ